MKKFIYRGICVLFMAVISFWLIWSCNSQKNALNDNKSTSTTNQVDLNKSEENTDLLTKDTLDSIIKINTDSEVKGNTKLVFPLILLTSFDVTNQDITYINKTIIYLNKKFEHIDIIFDVVSIEKKDIPYIEQLSDNVYEDYYKLSSKYDKKDTISLWVVENDEDKLCERTEYSITCSRTSGWTNVANTVTNNVVISRFDLTNRYIIAHEFGHFFGLDHTFEKWKYGVEKVDGSNCETAGDRICDTPADPHISEIFVSYSECELFYKNYKPLINNIMAYYKPCVHKKKEFTEGQYIRMYQIANTVHKHNAKEILKKYK